jgi:DNA-binding MarR family transcriptional regulator
MACLWNQDKVTQQALCHLTAKDKPSMTRLIDKLEKSRLVRYVADPNDRRINLIHLTTDGVTLQAKATEIVTRITQRTLNNITDEELMTSRSVLKKS